MSRFIIVFYLEDPDLVFLLVLPHQISNLPSDPDRRPGVKAVIGVLLLVACITGVSTIGGRGIVGYRFVLGRGCLY